MVQSIMKGLAAVHTIPPYPYSHSSIHTYIHTYIHTSTYLYIQRSKLAFHGLNKTPVNEETFAQWKKDKAEQRKKENAEKVGRLIGR